MNSTKTRKRDILVNEAVFKAAEGESEIAQLKIEEVSAIDCRSRSYQHRKNYPLEAVASAAVLCFIFSLADVDLSENQDL